MTNKLKHFAIYIDNMNRAKTFYSNLFGWGFNSYGSEDFFQIKESNKKEAELIGALQSRNYSPLNKNIIGFECSIEVQDIDEIITRINNNEGEIVMPKTEIPYVGWLVKFLDTEGNILCVVQYFDTIK